MAGFVRAGGRVSDIQTMNEMTQIAIEEWAAATRAGDADDPDAGATIRALADAALGLRL